MLQMRISMAAVRRFAREVGRRFQPEKIILFGSYAYGAPSADSDVDILVVMPTRSELDQAVKICWEIPVAFPMDLIVRTPRHLERQLADGDSFHTLIVTKGKTLYEKANTGMGAQGRKRLSAGKKARPKPRTIS